MRRLNPRPQAGFCFPFSSIFIAPLFGQNQCPTLRTKTKGRQKRRQHTKATAACFWPAKRCPVKAWPSNKCRSGSLFIMLNLLLNQKIKISKKSVDFCQKNRVIMGIFK
jgi:hypothetical protein